MRTRVTLAATAAALVVTGTACTGPTAEVGAPPTPTPVPTKKTAPQATKTDPLADPASPRRIVYAPGLVSDPLPARQRNVGVDRADIEKKVKVKDFGPALQPGQGEATLRLVTVSPDPSAKATGRPAWVLTWSGSEPDIKGPAGRNKQERKALADKLNCVFVLVVDANTGASLDARQLCSPKGG